MWGAAPAGGQGAERARGESRRLRIVNFNDVCKAAPRAPRAPCRCPSLAPDDGGNSARYDAAAGEPLVLFSGARR
jgi:hypothetical protein